MADEFDPALIGVQLDRAEEAGLIETDVAAALRGLVAGPIRLPAPRSFVTRQTGGRVLAEMAWHDGTEAIATFVELREDHEGRDYVFVLAGIRFLFSLARFAPPRPGPPDVRLRCLGCNVVRIGGDTCEYCGGVASERVAMGPAGILGPG